MSTSCPPFHGVSLDFVRELAKEAGNILVDGFHKKQKVNFKSNDSDLVTEYDVKIENNLISTIQKKFPDHKFFCEETIKPGSTLGDEPTWIIDPIDGTTNFVHSIPLCCVSIGFSVNKEIGIGVIYNPILEEEFYARKDFGSYLNGNLLSLSNSKKLSESLVSSSLGLTAIRNLRLPRLTDEERDYYERIKKNSLSILSNIGEKCRDFRSIGSCALEMAFLACGRIDVCFEFQAKEWDMAAGVLIVQESGGYIYDLSGEKVDMRKNRFLASVNKTLLDEVLKEITYVERPSV